MDESSSMTLTSAVLIAFCLVIFGLIIYRFFGHRQAVWSARSYKEEKIGLSAHKLFKPNGYMIHSGSELLLSSSGSFKRFDTVDKESCKHATQLQNSPKHATTPLWNIPQTESEIPPQPLRPAPAPAPVAAPSTALPPMPAATATQTKIVTFSLQLTDENPSVSHRQPSDMFRPTSILQTSPKQHVEIPTLEAPPKPKMAYNNPMVSTSSIPSASAIPRPVIKKSPQQNGFSVEDNPYSFKSFVSEDTNLQRAYNVANNTNPFLENLSTISNPIKTPRPITTTTTTRTCSNTALSTPQQQQQQQTMTNHRSLASTPTTMANPFIETKSESLESSPVRVREQQTRYNETPVFTFRTRSFSQTEVPDTEASTLSLKNLANAFNNATQSVPNPGNPFTRVARKMKGPHMLQKTISEDFLFRKFGYNFGGGQPNGSSVFHENLNGNDPGTTNSSWNFRSLLMQEDAPFNLWRRNSSQTSLNSESMTSLDGGNLERAISCESVDSDYASLDYNNEYDQSTYTQITGYLCVALHYERNPMTNEGVDLQVDILEAKGLLLPFKVNSIDTFVRVYLVPDQTKSMQTKVVEDTNTPVYKEALHFWLNKMYPRHSLWFHLFHSGDAHTLIGEAEMEIGDLPKPTTTWIPLTDSRKLNAQWGELMFSLSYLPTAERITIVVVKARNLQLRVPSKRDPEIIHDVQNIFVKVYLMNNDKKVLKKRTSLKRKDRCPVFNEFVIFSLPPQSLTTAQIRFTVYGVIEDTNITPLGHVVAGSCVTGKGLRHWHQMLSSLRKPVAMWHVLRRGSNQPAINENRADVVTSTGGGGGGGGVATASDLRNKIQCAKRNSVF